MRDLLPRGRAAARERAARSTRPVEWLSEENYFFALSSFADRLARVVRRAIPEPSSPRARRNEALGLIRQGLEDISITRTSFDWGIPVPWDPEHVVYVWFDALINYVTAVGYGEDEERFAAVVAGRRTTSSARTSCRFHCVWWPAMCMAAGIDPPRAGLRPRLPARRRARRCRSPRRTRSTRSSSPRTSALDPLRYHLLRDVTLGADGDFTYEGLIARYNADLANNLGNLLQRVATVVGRSAAAPDRRPEPAGGATAWRRATEVVAAASAAWERSDAPRARSRRPGG